MLEQFLIQTKRKFYSLMVVMVAAMLHSLIDLIGVAGGAINISHSQNCKLIDQQSPTSN